MSILAHRREDLKQPLMLSSVGHGILLLIALFSFPFSHGRGEHWGSGGGGAIQVSAVRNLPGVPLPRPPVVAESQVASESKSLYKEEAKPEPKTQPKVEPKVEEKVKEIPRFGEEPKKQPPRRAGARREEPQPL
ncbi:MAG: hypothetical protein L0338_09330, partial [Acidobacteria bacterium]|nr:hypothetical protein [Acidobacteriota bacterium]